MCVVMMSLGNICIVHVGGNMLYNKVHKYGCIQDGGM